MICYIYLCYLPVCILGDHIVAPHDVSDGEGGGPRDSGEAVYENTPVSLSHFIYSIQRRRKYTYRH